MAHTTTNAAATGTVPTKQREAGGSARAIVPCRTRGAPGGRAVGLSGLALALITSCGGPIDEGFEPEAEGEVRQGTFEIAGEPVELDYQIVDGLIVVEDDIVLDPEDEIPAEDALGAPGTVSQGLLSERKSSGHLWPGGVVPYRIHSSVTTPKRVRKAMREWEEKTSIRFVPRTDEAAFVVFKEQAGNRVCKANVGYDGGKQFVYLRDSSLGSGTCNLGVITHEIGHILGLWHEHTRGDRDDYVNIIWKNVALTSAFKKKTTGVRKVGPYDIKSTMHYRSYTLSSPSNKPSIKKKDGSLILHDWSDLSPRDIAAMAILYP